MYKFLGIQSRKDASNEYQPKGDYLSPSEYENKYGKMIEDKFKGYMPIGDYLFNDADKFKQSKIWPSIQTEFNKYQPKGDYTLNSTFNAYKDTVSNTYALKSDFNAYKDTVSNTYQPKNDYTLNSDFNAYKDTVNHDYALKSDMNDNLANYVTYDMFNQYRDNNFLTTNEFNDYRTAMNTNFNTISQQLQQLQVQQPTNATQINPSSYLRHLRRKNHMFY